MPPYFAQQASVFPDLLPCVAQQASVFPDLPPCAAQHDFDFAELAQAPRVKQAATRVRRSRVFFMFARESVTACGARVNIPEKCPPPAGVMQLEFRLTGAGASLTSRQAH